MNQNLKKKFVKEIKKLLKKITLFVSKKDIQLKIYVNYWKLNIITIKN